MSFRDEGEPPIVSIFLPTFLIGGAEKVLVELAGSLVSRGWKVHLLVMNRVGPMADGLNPAVEVVDLNCRSFKQAIFKLAHYYKSRKPSIVLSSLFATGLAVVAARMLSTYRPIVIIGAQNSLAGKVQRPDNVKDKWLLLPLCRWLFPLADGFIPVSKGLGEELETLLRLPKEKIRVIYNPVVHPGLNVLASESLDHPWLTGAGDRPFKTIVSVGRLVEQKAYDVLLRAFALMRKRVDCKLIIVGGGPLQEDLKSLAEELGVQSDVDFVGWQLNSHKYVARGDLFVLASRWDGLATALIEALACGVPTVATDCNYGPQEILENGKHGRLAKVDDPIDLSEKIMASLQGSEESRERKQARLARSRDFSVDASVGQYETYFRELIVSTGRGANPGA